MGVLKIRKWEIWQSYRADRGQPPWIKVHRQVMRNPDWVSLTDAQRGQVVAIWLLAADQNGVIPASPALIKKLCYLDAEPDLKLLMDKGFIEYDDTLASSWRQLDQPETEAETETETETDLGTNVPIVGSKLPPYQEIVKLYHEKLPLCPQVKKLTETRKRQIKARWSADIPDLDTWDKYFTYVSQSKFLTGQTPPVNGHKLFVADIEWLTKESNFIKVWEGKYHGV